MTVKELIVVLEKMNPNAGVLIGAPAEMCIELDLAYSWHEVKEVVPSHENDPYQTVWVRIDADDESIGNG